MNTKGVEVGKRKTKGLHGDSNLSCKQWIDVLEGMMMVGG